MATASAQDASENEIEDSVGALPFPVGESIIRPISEEGRRERLRSLFTRRKEETTERSEAETAEQEASTQRPRSRFFRPRTTTARAEEAKEEEDDLEGFSVSSSVSSSISSSVSRRVQPIRGILGRRKEQNNEESGPAEEVEEKEEEEEEPRPRFTQRKRFRLNKTSSRNRGSIVERVLENIDKQNEVEATGARRIRFRPSVRRENIRKKVQEAVNTEDDGVPAPRLRPRFRPQVSVTTSFKPRDSHDSLLQRPRESGTTAAVTAVTEGAIRAETEPAEIVTEPIVIRTETAAPPATTVLGNES